jgi:flagellar L-ring protein precursor FlgH
MKHNSFIVLSIIFIITGCSKPTIDMDVRPTIQVPKQTITTNRKKGTLYSRQGTSLFADKKDLQVGDILQIIVSESVKNDTKGARNLAKTGTSTLGGGMFSPAKGVTLGSTSQNRLNKFNNSLGIGFSSTSTSSLAGSASSKVDEKFTTTISVIIEQTYQNGNYFVKGSKEMLIDEQKQTIAISGVIRPYDITPENTIYSHQLANLKIKYIKDGEEVDSLHKSWGSKILEYIWPF